MLLFPFDLYESCGISNGIQWHLCFLSFARKHLGGARVDDLHTRWMQKYWALRSSHWPLHAQLDLEVTQLSFCICLTNSYWPNIKSFSFLNNFWLKERRKGTQGILPIAAHFMKLCTNNYDQDTGQNGSLHTKVNNVFVVYDIFIWDLFFNSGILVSQKVSLWIFNCYCFICYLQLKHYSIVDLFIMIVGVGG